VQPAAFVQALSNPHRPRAEHLAPLGAGLSAGDALELCGYPLEELAPVEHLSVKLSIRRLFGVPH
jgi:hypothetical protein